MLDWGSSDFDIRHRAAISMIWQTPWAKDGTGLAHQALGGYTIVPVFTVRTGTPFSIFDTTNSLNAGSGYGLNEYLYVSGGDPQVYYQGLEHSGNTDNRILASDPTLPVPALAINRTSVVGTPTAQRYPWGTVVTVHVRTLNTPEITSTITLNDEQKVVSFENEVESVARRAGLQHDVGVEHHRHRYGWRARCSRMAAWTSRPTW